MEEKTKKTEKKYGAYSNMGFFPIKDIVLVELLYVKPVEQSGLVLPENVKKNTMIFDKYPYQAVVAAVGPGFDETHPCTVRPGQRVYLHSLDINQEGEINPTRWLTWDKKNYYKCQEGNIIGIADSDTDMPVKEEKESPIKIIKSIKSDIN